jgi:FKBP-type peptidyl-prolyl cis-trans isomerase
MKPTKVFSFFLILFVISCDDNRFFYEPDFSTVPPPFVVDESTKVILDNGLIYYDVDLGSGQFTVTLRDAVELHYTGRKTNNEIFDSSYKDGFTTPTTMNISSINPQTGGFGLIEGFRLGLEGMKEGGKRRVVIPPSLGYGGTGSDLANDTLIFDMEVFKIVNQ